MFEPIPPADAEARPTDSMWSAVPDSLNGTEKVRGIPRLSFMCDRLSLSLEYDFCSEIFLPLVPLSSGTLESAGCAEAGAACDCGAATGGCGGADDCADFSRIACSG